MYFKVRNFPWKKVSWFRVLVRKNVSTFPKAKRVKRLDISKWLQHEQTDFALFIFSRPHAVLQRQSKADIYTMHTMKTKQKLLECL